MHVLREWFFMCVMIQLLCYLGSFQSDLYQLLGVDDEIQQRASGLFLL